MKEIDYSELNFNPMTMVAKKWMLVTAGTMDEYNTMTVSWGHLGSLWGHGGGRPTVVVYIRPQRYTKKFVDESDYFTVSVYPEEFKKDLSYLGTHSGKDEDKVSETSLTPVSVGESVTFQQAELTFLCRKLYVGRITEEGFVDKFIIEDNYPLKDFHYVYIGEIERTFVE